MSSKEVKYGLGQLTKSLVKPALGEGTRALIKKGWRNPWSPVEGLKCEGEQPFKANFGDIFYTKNGSKELFRGSDVGLPVIAVIVQGPGKEGIGFGNEDNSEEAKRVAEAVLDRLCGEAGCQTGGKCKLKTGEIK